MAHFNWLLGAIVAVVLLVVVLVMFVVTLVTFRPWFRAFLYGTPVSATDILAIRLRGNPPALLVDAYIALQRAGESATIKDVENAYIDARNRIITSEDLVYVVKTRTGADV